MSQSAPVFLISGAPGSGKTAVATALMKRFDYGMHIPMDKLREWVVSGFAYPLYTWKGETNRQFDTAREAAAHMARLYAGDGCAVAIDDVIFPGELIPSFTEPMSDHPLHKVLLLPRLEVALTRNARRQSKEFHPSRLEKRLRCIHGALSDAPFDEAGWLIIDNSETGSDETAGEIMRRTGCR